MNIVRKLLGFLLVFAVAAMAAPAFAQKTYSLIGTPDTIPYGESGPYFIKVKNTSPFDNSNPSSFRLVAPKNIEFKSVVQDGNSFPSATVTLVGWVGTGDDRRSVIEVVTGQALQAQQQFPLKITMNGLSCGTSGAWTPPLPYVNGTRNEIPRQTRVYAGSSLNGDQFAPDGSWTTTVTGDPTIAMSISPSPATNATNDGNVIQYDGTDTVPVAYAVTVSVFAGCSGNGAGQTVSLTTTNGTTIGSANPATTTGTGVNGTATFTDVRFVNLGASKLTATATSLTTATSPGGISTSKTYTAYEDEGLACDSSTSWPPTSLSSTSQFVASDPPTAGTSDPGFAKGYRGANKQGTCNLVSYTFVNNIQGSASVTDQLNREVPQNFVSFNWDTAYQPYAVYVYTVTWKPEKTGTDGLPATVTKYCAPNADSNDPSCTTKNAVQQCLGTSLAAASMPAGQPICILQETRTTVPWSKCSTDTQPSNQACIVVTTTVMDHKDPPIGREL